MTLASFFVLLPGVLSGGLLVHLLWPDRRLSALLLKASLGAGLGLGLSSLLHLGSLVVSGGRILILPVTLALLVLLGIMTVRRERRAGRTVPHFSGLSRIQWLLLAADLIALVLLALAFVNLSISRPQGAFDAWSIWDRAARFIYRDPANWQATLSPELYWGNHADYPLLVPLNVAWGWQALGTETLRLPMMQGALFTLAAAGLLFSAVSLVKSWGQGALAALVLMGMPVFVVNGSGLIADIPVMYFILAACVLIFLWKREQSPALLALAGFMAGLAGWSKNEGLLFILVSPLGVYLAQPRSPIRPLLAHLAGLAVPLMVILAFKSIAPPGDIFAGGDSLAKITDPARYAIILKALGAQALTFGGGPPGLLPVLAVYALAMGAAQPPDARRGLAAIGAILILQLLGYCAIFVLTPHDLAWHLGTALARLVLHIYPSGLFLLFCMARTPEEIFERSAASAPQGKPA